MKNIVEFEKTITAAEAKSFYLNLKDNFGKRYGLLFPPDRTQLWIISDGNRYLASKRGDNQVWGGLRKWYDGENIEVGDTIKINYDPNSSFIEGRAIIEFNKVKNPTVDFQKIEEAIIENNEDFIQEVIEVEESLAAEITIQMEYELETYIVSNLHLIEKGLELYSDNNGYTGRQYNTDVGRIDLLCKKGDDFVIIELKKGKSSDDVVGQISRYIGWVSEKLSKNNKVRGIIIVHDYDIKLKYAVDANPNIEIKYYHIKIDFISEDVVKNKMKNFTSSNKVPKIKPPKGFDLTSVEKDNIHSSIDKKNSKTTNGRNDGLTDYLIPVIIKIKSGTNHTEAFKKIAEKLNVTKETVTAQCSTTIGIKVNEFVELIRTEKIKDFLKNKFPKRINIIDNEL